MTPSAVGINIPRLGLAGTPHPTGKPLIIAIETNLHDAKVRAIHFKQKVGKFSNILNPNHRHDEEHEKATDRKRTAVAESHRFESFAPEHDNNNIKWYVDGRDYFWAVSVALEKAEETIYIADWWLSPELFLRRPPHYNQEYRIDQILKRKAEAGVQIYVNVYKEACDEGEIYFRKRFGEQLG